MKYVMWFLSVALLLSSNYALAKTCEYGKPVSGTKNVTSKANMLDAKGADYHKGPGWNFDRKPYPNPPGATVKVLGYISVSSSDEVKLLCKKDKWIKVTPIKFGGEPLKPTPNNFGIADGVGWIHTKFLEEEKSKLEKQGLWWTPDIPHLTEDMTERQAEIAVKGALQLLKSSAICNKISSVDYDADALPSRRYTASCESAQSERSSVNFGKAEVLSNTGVQIAQPYPKAKAIRRCRDAVSVKARHPSSINWAYFRTNVEQWSHDLQLVTIYFSAQNSFGARFNYRAVCRVLSSGKIESMSLVETN